MDITPVRDLLSQIQSSARVSTVIGEPVTVGERVVIPVVEVAYAGGGGGGSGQMLRTDHAEGGGGGGGGGVRVRPLGCWVVGPLEARWLPALDVNRIVMIGGAITLMTLLTIRALLKRC